MFFPELSIFKGEFLDFIIASLKISFVKIVNHFESKSFSVENFSKKFPLLQMATSTKIENYFTFAHIYTYIWETTITQIFICLLSRKG